MSEWLWIPCLQQHENVTAVMEDAMDDSLADSLEVEGDRRVRYCKRCDHAADLHWSQDAFGFKGRGCVTQLCKCAGFEERDSVNSQSHPPIKGQRPIDTAYSACERLN